MTGVSERIEIQNLKCAGCARTITKELDELKGVFNVRVDINASSVEVDLLDQTVFPEVLSTLRSLGYPSVLEKNTLLKKAKSIISCASGKIN